MTAPDPFAAARDVAVTKVLLALAGASKDSAGAQALGLFPVGTRLPVVLGGKTIAFVSVPNPTRRASVKDDAKFLAWVQENRPDEVEMVPVVRDSFKNAILRKVKDHGGLPDENGEVTPVPGVAQEYGDPYVKVDLEDDAPQFVGAAWRSGDLDIGSLLALPAGGEQS